MNVPILEKKWMNDYDFYMYSIILINVKMDDVLIFLNIWGHY